MDLELAMVTEYTAIHLVPLLNEPRPSLPLLYKALYITPCYNREDPVHRFEVREITVLKDGMRREDFRVCRVFKKEEAVVYIASALQCEIARRNLNQDKNKLS